MDQRSELISSIDRGVCVVSWRLPPSSDTPIDDFFSINLSYKDYRNRNAVLVMFRMPKEINRDNIISRVYDMLLETFDDPNGRSYYCVIDVVTKSCERLLQEVSEGSHRSLAMTVEVEVFDDDYDYDDDYYDAVPTELEYLKFEDDDDYDVVIVDRCVNVLEENCAICLDEFVSSEDNVVVLCCSHVLHDDCLKPWVMKGKNTCPLCRSKLGILEIIDIHRVKEEANN